MGTAQRSAGWSPSVQGMGLILALGVFQVQTAYTQTPAQYPQRAMQASSTKAWDVAIANYHHALDLEPNDALTRYNLALALKYNGESRQAVDEFERALALKPKWADAHFGLGATWLELNDLSSARKELQAAVELDPKNPNAHLLLARDASHQYDLRFAHTHITHPSTTN